MRTRHHSALALVLTVAVAANVSVHRASQRRSRPPRRAAMMGDSATPGVLAGALIHAVLMLGVCLLACVVPTRRALDVQPTEALRADG